MAANDQQRQKYVLQSSNIFGIQCVQSRYESVFQAITLNETE